MKRRAFRDYFFQCLLHLYDGRECKALFRCYVEERLGIPTHRFFLDLEEEMVLTVAIQQDLQQLAVGVPIQHLVGRTEFYGRTFSTDARALVPRRETEELLYHILREAHLPTGPAIFDICTGSGVIAITLAKEIPAAQVAACDISADALALAQQNAAQNGAVIDFQQCDILQLQSLPQQYDLIVSNPPYIPYAEYETLHPNVRNYDPALALVVPDDAPCIFYQHIVQLAQQGLRTNGYLYFEIHESYADEVVQLFSPTYFYEVRCWNDMQGKPRFVAARRV